MHRRINRGADENETVQLRPQFRAAGGYFTRLTIRPRRASLPRSAVAAAEPTPPSCRGRVPSWTSWLG